MPQMVYIQQSPGVYSKVVQAVDSYDHQVVQPQAVTVEEPKEVYTPTTYMASPQPVFFEKLLFGGYKDYKYKSNYGGYGHSGRRNYPTYGDYYRTHRYPINDGWMLWDEDLRDKDTAKADKFGSGKKDGGR